MPPPPPAPAPPGPPPPGAGKKKANWRMKYKQRELEGPSLAEQELADARAVFGDAMPDWRLKMLMSVKPDDAPTGLGNDGATCYMNSLLQALFVIPEFRTALYAWQYDPLVDAAPESCIPLQLQTLFAAMQLANVRAVSTRALTVSFGWTAADMFMQSDVQELCRVLFDALDVSFALSAQPSPTRLFRGACESYIRCRGGCGTQMAREEAWADLNVPCAEVASVEAAIAAFQAAELLAGDNRYSCAACASRQEADKGLRLTRLPHVLSLQLGRFSFDYATMAKVKLNHEVRFERLLRLGELVPADPTACYELLAVLVHSGGAQGGHYYCYCRDLAVPVAPHAEPDADASWLHLNDTETSRTTWANVQKAYGVPRSEGAKRVGACAYMLLYRRCDDAAHPAPPPGPEAIPGPTRERYARLNAEHVAQHALYVSRRARMTLVLYRSDRPTPMDFAKTDTLRAVTAAARAALAPDVPDECVRLRRYNPETRVAGDAFSGREEASLEVAKCYSGMALLLESREASARFPPVDAYTVRVCLVGGDGAEGASLTLSWDLDEAEAAAALATGAVFAELDARGVPTADARVIGFVAGGAGAENLRVHAREDAPARLIDECGLMSGAALHVAASADALRVWFDASANRLLLNLSGGGEATAGVAFVCVDRRESVLALKRALLSAAPRLSATDAFRVRRHKFGPELADALSLADAGFQPGATVYVESGRPLQGGEMTLAISRFSATAVAQTAGAAPTDRGVIRFLCDLVVSKTWPLSEVRALLAAPLAAACGAPVAPECVRLRELLGEKIGAILLGDDVSLGDALLPAYRTRDRLDLAVELLPGPEPLRPGQLLLSAFEWRAAGPDGHEGIGRRLELVVQRSDTKRTLLARLAAEANAGNAVDVAKVYYTTQLASEAAVAALSWDVAEDASLTASPWYLRDGDLVVFRDAAAAAAKAVRVAAEAAAAGASARVETALRIRVQGAAPHVDAPAAPHAAPSQ